MALDGMSRKTVIALAVERMLEKAVCGLPEDAVRALKNAEGKETDGIAKAQLRLILKNIDLAARKRAPMCQDTGTLTFYVRGDNMGMDIAQGIREGVRRATDSVPLRPNSVDPVTRKNLGNEPNINYEISDVGRDCVEISVIPKGAGCENMSSLAMLAPADGLGGVKRFVLATVAENGKNACPPLVVGIGIGGTSEQAMELAKKSFLAPLDKPNADKRLAGLEHELLKSINALGLGTMGLGGRTTALAVKVSAAPTHTASLPVAINMQCWAQRKATARICGDKIEIL
ncbi:MAG: fumarate hydratase [Candidatus Micrarchaeota archaeon]